MHIDYISTKFYIPVAPARYVVRPRLVDKLHHQEGVRLSLLTAPAGFGKTTTVIHSIKDIKAKRNNRFSKVAWLSLDEHDNSLVEFVSYFIGAVQQVDKGFAADLQISISSGQNPTISYAAKELINQFAVLDTPLHFVLDDCHVITDPKISELINLVVDYLPPHIHFIMTSRKPVPFDLPRWRGRGWLNEVDAKQLRFTLSETETFLSQTMQITPNSEIVPKLQDHTGGWVVGLQLAAYSLRESEDHQNFLTQFGGGSRYISDYLMAEVFAKQTAPVQDFLLKTSITDKCTPALCAAIMTIDAPLSHTILDELKKSDLFVTPLDHQGHWFQYHKIFLEFLEKQRQIKLDTETISQLHQNVAQWYGEQGFIAKAIDHSLLVKKYDDAIRWLQEMEFEQVWDRSIGSKFLVWIPQFPTDKLKEYPQLALAASGAFLVRSEGKLLNEMLEILRDCEETQNEYQLFIGAMLRSTDQNRALEIFRQVADATTTENVFHHLALSQIGVVLMEMGELKQATDIMAEFNQDYIDIGIPQTGIWLQLIYLLSHLYYLQGQLDKAESILTQGFEHLSQAHHHTPLIGLLHNGMGQIYWGRNELDTAEKHYLEALRWGNLSGTVDMLHLAYLGMSNIMLAKHDENAFAQLDSGHQLFGPNNKWGPHSQTLAAQKAFIHLNLDHHTEAIDWADRSGFAVDDLLHYPNLSLYQIYIAIKLHQFYRADDKDNLINLLPLIESLQEQAQSANHIHHNLNSLIAKSIIYDQIGHKKIARSALDEALAILEQTDLLRLFLLWKQPLHNLLINVMGTGKHRETIRRLLLALAEQPGMEPTDRANTIEHEIALTNREIEILTLIALGLTNKKIASQLVISENTLRTHVRNLYRKLGVHNRTQAMKTGQELGLL